MNNRQLHEKIMTNIRKSLTINEMGVMHHRPDTGKKLALLYKFFEDLYKMPGYTVSIYRQITGARYYYITGKEQLLKKQDIQKNDPESFEKYDNELFFKSFDHFMCYIDEIMSSYENRFNNMYFRISTSCMDSESISQIKQTGLTEYNQSSDILSISFFKLFWNIELTYDIFYGLHNSKIHQLNDRQYNKFVDFFINLCHVPDIMIKFSDRDDMFYISNKAEMIDKDDFTQLTLAYRNRCENDYKQLLQKLFGYIYDYNIHFADDINDKCKDAKMSIYLLDKEDIDMLCKYGFAQFSNSYGVGVTISLTDLFDNIDEIYDAFYAEDEIHESAKNDYKNLIEGECCDCGAVVADAGAGMYNNAFNTVGIGDIVPAGMGTLGSGDRFDNCFTDTQKNRKKKKSSNKKNRVYTKR